jgi:general stress protein 26
MNESLINQAEQLLTQCNVCTVASISKQGYPRICVLMPIEAKGIKEFWFSTGTNGTKVNILKTAASRA